MIILHVQMVFSTLQNVDVLQSTGPLEAIYYYPSFGGIETEAQSPCQADKHPTARKRGATTKTQVLPAGP